MKVSFDIFFSYSTFVRKPKFCYAFFWKGNSQWPNLEHQRYQAVNAILACLACAKFCVRIGAHTSHILTLILCDTIKLQLKYFSRSRYLLLKKCFKLLIMRILEEDYQNFYVPTYFLYTTKMYPAYKFILHGGND